MCRLLTCWWLPGRQRPPCKVALSSAWFTVGSSVSYSWHLSTPGWATASLSSRVVTFRSKREDLSLSTGQLMVLLCAQLFIAAFRRYCNYTTLCMVERPTWQQDTFGLGWSEKASLAVEGSSTSVACEQPSGGGFWGTLWGTLRGQKSRRGSNVFKFCCNKIIHMHAGRTRSVLLAQAEDIMRSGDILSKSSSTTTATRSRHNVSSFSRLNVVWFTTAEISTRWSLVTQ